ncbi:hypothetical protein Tco_0645144, partial [Tanacetum coccineum]
EDPYFLKHVYRVVKALYGLHQAPRAWYDEVLAEILFRGQYVSGAGVVVVDKLPDDEIVDPRVKVEPISESASSPP